MAKNRASERASSPPTEYKTQVFRQEYFFSSILEREAGLTSVAQAEAAGSSV
ncbi:MAG TPA: hypothetical protein V6D26_17330 [Stenomitos sp.]